MTSLLALPCIGKEAQSLDRRPAFIPAVTLVVLLKEKRPICVIGKKQDPALVMLIRIPD
jgi:hypothetical protein